MVFSPDPKSSLYTLTAFFNPRYSIKLYINFANDAIAITEVGTYQNHPHFKTLEIKEIITICENNIAKHKTKTNKNLAFSCLNTL